MSPPHDAAAWAELLPHRAGVKFLNDVSVKALHANTRYRVTHGRVQLQLFNVTKAAGYLLIPTARQLIQLDSSYS